MSLQPLEALLPNPIPSLGFQRTLIVRRRQFFACYFNSGFPCLSETFA